MIFRRFKIILFLLVLHVFTTESVTAENENIVSIMPKMKIELPQDHELATIVTDGERMAVGVCDRYPTSSSKGSVHLYKRVGNEWKQSNIIQSQLERSTSFGCSVVISGDLLVVGESEFSKKKGQGAIHIFRFQNEEWVNESIIPFPRSSDHWLTGFGENVLIKHDEIIVSAHVYWAGIFSGQKTSGEVYVFGKSGKKWTLKQTLRPFENVDAHGFGQSLGVSGEVLSVGSARNVRTGIIYLFRKQGEKWVPLDSLVPPQEKIYQYGEHISVSENYIVSSAYDHPVFIMDRHLDNFRYDSMLVPTEKNIKYVDAKICKSALTVQGSQKVGEKEQYFVDVYTRPSNSWEKILRLVSQLDDAKWIGVKACLENGFVLADTAGNLYEWSLPAKH